MVCDILPSQDASTHLIWNFYLKEYRSFAPDLMPILETRPEVKVTVTGKWNVTIRHFKMHSHTKGKCQCHRDPRMVRDSLSSQDASTYQIWDSYLKYYRRYAPDTIILKTRSDVEVKVTVTWTCYETLCYLNMHPHTKIGIPTSKNKGDMHRTGRGTDGLTEGQTDGGMDKAITICLPQFLWGHKNSFFLKNWAHDCRKPSVYIQYIIV